MQSLYWISETVGGCAQPQSEADLLFLRSEGVTTIVNLREEVHYRVTPVINEFQIVSIPIEDFSVPTLDQVSQLWRVYNKVKSNKEKLVLHCLAGCGRTGTMTASLLLLLNPKLTADEAIKEVRSHRPCSLEVDTQVNFVHKVLEYRDMILNS